MIAPIDIILDPDSDSDFSIVHRKKEAKDVEIETGDLSSESILFIP